MVVALRDALHGQAVGGEPQGQLALLVQLPGLVERARDDRVEARVDLLLGPEVLLQALHPLEVRDDDPAGVGEDVGEDEDASLLEDLVGLGSDRAVRALADDRGLDAVRVLGRDHLLERAGSEQVALQLEQLLGVDLLGAGEVAERAVLPLPGERRGDVDALLVVEGDGRVGDADHLRAVLVQEHREVAADVPEALDDAREAVEAAIELLQRLAHREERSAGRRLLAAERAADVERLAGHDAEHRMALVHRVRVEDPRHGLGVRVHVRRRDVGRGADLVHDLAREAAGHPLELALRHRLRIAGDAALGAPEGDTGQGALPGHPHRQRPYLVEGDVGVVADAALRRPARQAVLDAIALEDLHPSVVHPRRDGDHDPLLAPLEHPHERFVEPEHVGDPAQLRACHLVRVLLQMSLACDGGHSSSFIRVRGCFARRTCA